MQLVSSTASIPVCLQSCLIYKSVTAYLCRMPCNEKRTESLNFFKVPILCICLYSRLVLNVRHKRNMSCSLDCCGQLPLMICTSASHSSRQNLCPFCHALSQLCDVLVINDIYSVYAEHADLFSRSFSAHSWCSFHGQILLTAFRKFRFCFLQF